MRDLLRHKEEVIWSILHTLGELTNIARIGTYLDGLFLVLITQTHISEERRVLSQSDWKNFCGKLSTGGLSPFGEVLKLRRRLKIKKSGLQLHSKLLPEISRDFMVNEAHQN